MTNATEDGMVAMLAGEQRAFRRILIAGVTVLFVLVMLSIALSFYFFLAAQTLQSTTLNLERHAFETRRLVERQAQQISQQQASLRTAFLEIRASGPTDVALTPAQFASAKQAAENYLRRGRRIPMADERGLRRAMSTDEALGTPAEKALLNGVLALSNSARISEQFPAHGLPRRLAAAQRSFTTALADPATQASAQAGLASVLFSQAQNARFPQAACNAVYAAVAASVVDGSPGPQPLYWRANCERKTGATAASLHDYALSLQLVTPQDNDGQGGGGRSELTLAQNAFHGIGTTLIALDPTAANDSNVRDAIAIARERCPAAGVRARNEQMRLAEACLQKAISIRRDQLQQSDAEIAGTQENLGFAFLRDGNSQQAFDNAQAIEPDLLSPWNELIRAYASTGLKTPAARAAHQEALRNVGFFDVNQFNICEIQRLLTPADYGNIISMIQGARGADGKKAVDDAVAACAHGR